jgi:hypothetical protein
MLLTCQLVTHVELRLDTLDTFVVGQCNIFSYLINICPGLFKVSFVVVSYKTMVCIHSNARLLHKLWVFGLLLNSLGGSTHFRGRNIKASPHVGEVGSNQKMYRIDYPLMKNLAITTIKL